MAIRYKALYTTPSSAPFNCYILPLHNTTHSYSSKGLLSLPALLQPTIQPIQFQPAQPGWSTHMSHCPLALPVSAGTAVLHSGCGLPRPPASTATSHSWPVGPTPPPASRPATASLQQPASSQWSLARLTVASSEGGVLAGRAA